MSDGNGFDEWGGYMDAKIAKLEEQFEAASAQYRESALFNGISIFVNGLTEPPASELKLLMMRYGGVYHHYKRESTTLTIASNLPDVKVRQHKGNELFVKPQWVVACIEAGRIVSFRPYLLLSNQKTSQPALSFKPAPGGPKVAKNPMPSDQTTQAEAVKKEQSFVPEVTHEQLDLLLKTARAGRALADVKSEKAPKADETVDPTETTIESDYEGDERNDSELTDFVNDTVNQSSTHGGHRNKPTLTAAHPDFLEEFYQNSRLHQISSLKNQFITMMRNKRELDPPGKFEKLQLLKEQYKERGLLVKERAEGSLVMHIDMDCFFVSVGLLKHPELRGQPVVVTHSKGGQSAMNVPVHAQANRAVERQLFVKNFEDRDNPLLATKVKQGFESRMSLSEVASCSYEARQCGVKNGMFVGQAMKLCPNLQVMPYEFEEYKRVGTAMYEVLCQYTLDIEPVSCDEMYVNLDGILECLQVPVMEFVRTVRTEIATQTGCPCSAGVGANKLQARVATMSGKPNNQFHLQPLQVVGHMANLSVGDLPGVGQSGATLLREHNIVTCGDLQRRSLHDVQQIIGPKLGHKLHLYSHGDDDRPLDYMHERKTISMDINYGIRFKTSDEAKTFLMQLCSGVHKMLLEERKNFAAVGMKIMRRAPDAPQEASKFMGHGVCNTLNKTKTLTQPTNELTTIKDLVLRMYDEFKVPPQDLRGIAIQLKKLVRPEKPSKQGSVLLSMFNRIRQTKSAADEAPRKSPVKRPGEQPATKQPPLPKVIKQEETPPVVVHAKAVKTAQLPPKAQQVDQDDLTTSAIRQLMAQLDLKLPDDWGPDLLRLAVTELIQHEQNKPPVYDDSLPSTSKDTQKTIIPNRRLEQLRKLMELLDQAISVPSKTVLNVAQQSSTVTTAPSRDVSEPCLVDILDSPDSPPSEYAAPAYYSQQSECVKGGANEKGNFLLRDNFRAILSDFVMHPEPVIPIDDEQLVAHALQVFHQRDIGRVYDVLKHLHGLIRARTMANEEERARAGTPHDTELKDYVTCQWHGIYGRVQRAIEAEIAKSYDGWQLYTNFHPIQCTKCMVDRC